MPGKVGEKCDERNEQPLISNINAKPTGEDAVVCAARLTAHEVRFSLFHTEGKRGEAICDKIDPQQVHGFQDHEAKQRRKENAEHFAHVGAKQELDGFADVVIDAAAFTDRAYDSCKVVIRKHHVGNVFGNIGAGDTHANADVSALDARRIVYAITGHGSDAAMLAPCVYDADLVLRLHAGIHAVMVNGAAELFIADVIELRSGNGLTFIRKDAKLPRNGNCGIPVISRDHDRADARRAAFFDRGLDFRANGVDHTRKPEESKRLFKGGRGKVTRKCVIGAARYGKDAQRLIRHGLVCREKFCAHSIGHGMFYAILPIGSAALQNLIRCALGVLGDTMLRSVQRAHHLAHAVKGRFRYAGRLLLKLWLMKFKPCCPVYQCALRRFTDGLTGFIRRCIGAEGHSLSCGTFVAEVIHDRHFILGQRACFIAADDLRTTERLNSGEPADDGVALGHIGHADGKYDRYHCGKAFRNRGNGKAYCDHERADHNVKVEITRP